MPHIPDHTTHDPELVAAYAAGDATGADLRAATDLVATCPACAELHHDLRAIATALPEAAVPVRPRDFRLAPEQAAALRPAGWRGLLAAFAGPRFRFAAPLGLGLATLGLAGILVGSLAGLPLGVGGAATSGTRNMSDQGAVAVPSAAPSMVPAGPVASDNGTGPGSSPVPAASGDGDTANGGGTASGSPDYEGYAGATPSPADGKTAPGQAAAPPAALDAGLLVVAGGGCLAAGLVLVGLRWTSRRAR